MAKYTSQFSGQEIDQRLTEVSNKFGDAYFDPTTNQQYLFKSTDDKMAWLGGDTSVEYKTCPFEFSGTVNRMTVLNYMDGKNLYYTQMSESALITVGFKSEEKGITDTSWNEVIEDAYITVEVDRGVAGKYSTVVNEQLVLNGNTFTVDVIKYLATGNNRVRITAVGVDTGSRSNIVYSVMLTSMYLTPANFAWNVPFIEGNPFSLGGLYIGGSIDKTLKIKVTGDGYAPETITVPLGTSTNTNIAYYYNNLPFPTTGTGIYNVELWLDANGLESDHLNYNIMCVAAADVSTAQFVAVSGIASSVMNGSDNKLFSYAVYDGGKSSANPVVNVSTSTGYVIFEDEVLENVETAKIIDFSVNVDVETEQNDFRLYASIELGDSRKDITYTVDNSASYPAEKGAVFYLNPASRNNNQTNKLSVVNDSTGEAVDATWTNVSFTDGMDGWTEDNYGRKCLRLPAGSKVEVGYAPFANASVRTIELSYRIENSADFDEVIINLASDLTSDFVGARIKPTNIVLHSSIKKDDSLQSYNLKDEELVHMLITVARNYSGIGNLARVFVNGVGKLSFEWETSDSFAHNGNMGFGSETADLFIYKVLVYDMAFDWIKAGNNFIFCLPDKASKDAAYEKFHSVINDGDKIDFDKVKNGGLNYFTIRLPQGAKLPSKISPSSVPHSRLEINIQQNPAFVINGIYDDEEVEGQGTTAMDYLIWNLRWKTELIRITAKKNFASSMHSHKMAGTALFNDLNRMVVGPNEANARVAVEQYGAYGFLEVLKEGTTDQYDYIFIGLYTIGQDKGDKATFGYNHPDYKDTLIHMEGSDHKPMAIGMDYPWAKLKVHTNADGDSFLGVAQTDGSAEKAWEIGACGTAESDTEKLSYLTQEFKPAYDLDYLNTAMIEGVEAISNVDRLAETLTGYTYANCLLWVDGEYDTYYYDELQNMYLKDGINLLDSFSIDETTLNDMVAALGNISVNTDDPVFSNVEGLTVRDYMNLLDGLQIDASTLTTLQLKNLVFTLLRYNRYRNTMESAWHLRDSLFHYCFVILFAATDNFKKNTYPYKFGTLASGSRWRWRQDDLDTLADINNQGLATKIYSLLNGDKSGANHYFNGNNSYHWTNIRFYYANEIRSMMLEILTAMASLCPEGGSLIERALGCIRMYFWDKAQDYFTKSAYNLDAQYTYEEAWAAMKNGTYVNPPVNPLQQALGSHYEAERAWFELRFIFIASLYGFGAFGVGNGSDNSLGQITFRLGAGLSPFSLTPAINMNPTIVVGDSSTVSLKKRVMAGEAASLPIETTESDTSIYIQGADYLSDIGDFSKVNLYPDNPELRVASKRLQRLKVGDETADNVTTILKSLQIGSCPSLSEVDARNVSTLTGTVDLSQCPRLKKALFGGSSVSNITLPKGSKITEFDLPDTLTRLSLVGLPLLTVGNLKYGDITALTYLRVENNANIEGYALLKATYEDGSPLTNIRVIGFDYDGTANDITLLAELAKNCHGIDADGAENNGIIPVIEGTIRIAGSVYEDDLEVVTDAYGAGLTIAVTGGYYIRFADPEVQNICATNWGDGTGITQEQVEAVTDIGTKFQGNTAITSFDEFEKFTGVTSLAVGAYQGCTSLSSIKVPNGVTAFNQNSFNGCGALTSFTTDWSKIVSIGSSAFQNCTSLEIEDLSLPNLTSLGQNAFYGVKIKKISNLGNITTLPTATTSTQNFGNKSVLEEVVLPEEITSIGDFSFHGYSALKTLTSSPLKSLGRAALEGCGIENFDFSKIETINHYALKNCPLVIEDLKIPNLTSLGQNALTGNITRITDLGSITSLPYGGSHFNSTAPNLGNRSTLKSIVVPETVTSFEQFCLYGYNSMDYMICKPTNPPTLGVGALTYGNISTNSYPIYVPDGSVTVTETTTDEEGNEVTTEVTKTIVELYKEASGWSSYADRILSMTDYEWAQIDNKLTFADPAVEAICLANWDTDGDGVMSKAETLAVTSVGTVFKGNTEITGFDELRYFKNVTTLAKDAFSDSTSLMSIDLSNMTGMPIGAFNKCTSLKSVKGLDNITFVDLYTFHMCGLEGDIDMPEVTRICGWGFTGCENITSFTANKLTTIDGASSARDGIYGCFGKCTSLKKVTMLSVSSVGQYAFWSCTALEFVELGEQLNRISIGAFQNVNLKTLIMRATTPPTYDRIFVGGSIQQIFVPDEAVDAYKSSGWSSFTIKPLSEYVE